MEKSQDYSNFPADTVFRNAKKRRRLHPRRLEQEQLESQLLDEDIAHRDRGGLSSDDMAVDETMVEVARGRRNFARRNGIRFTTGPPETFLMPDPRQAHTTPSMVATSNSIRINDRFAAQTGKISESANKFMTAYIDNRINGTREDERQQTDVSERFSDGMKAMDDKQKHRDVNSEQQRERATLGRLQEIDLGPETQARNVARTAVATKRLHEQAIGRTSNARKHTESTQPDSPGRAARRSNQGRRRDHLDRDFLVDAILSETRTEHAYKTEEDGTEDMPTDDVMAAQFYAEYLEQAESRSAQALARAAKSYENAAAKNFKTSDRDEYAKGPKLGGSRMQRAAMRDKELAAKHSSSQRQNGGRR